MLKVEIAGDTQDTDGTGPSDMYHRHDTAGCCRGNAAWLIHEAKARNPNIATYGLPCRGMPAWVGGGDYWSDDSIVYFYQVAPMHGDRGQWHSRGLLGPVE